MASKPLIFSPEGGQESDVGRYYSDSGRYYSVQKLTSQYHSFTFNLLNTPVNYDQPWKKYFTVKVVTQHCKNKLLLKKRPA